MRLWVIEKTNIKINLSNESSNSFDLPHGKDGVDGKGIVDITHVENDDNTALTFNFTSGDPKSLTIPHGKQGPKGDTGNFNAGDLSLNLSDDKGLCINYGEKNSCISTDELKKTLYTKTEYAPVV